MKVAAVLCALLLAACTPDQPGPGLEAPVARGSLPPSGDQSPAEVVESFETPSFLHVPSEYPMGSDAVMPLTFTDGTQIELIHPQSLPLASLGVRPYVSACGTDLSVVWGDGEGVLYSGEAVNTFEGSSSTDSSQVGLYDRAAHVPGYVLVFPFGRWTAGALFQREHDPAIAGCAAGLRGSENVGGFLRLSAVGSISLMEQGHVGGPQMILGEAPPTSITLTAEECSPYEGKEVSVLNGYPVERYEGFAAWCVPEAGVQITVASKSEGLIDEVVASVKLRTVV